MKQMVRRCHSRIVYMTLCLLIDVAGCARESRKPLNTMCHENEIYKAITDTVRLAAQARSDEDLTRNLNYLRAMASKLTAGWDCLIVDEYHPSGFSSDDLLGELFAEIARTIRDTNPPRKAELISFLWETKPTRQDIAEMWAKIVISYKIEFVPKQP